MKAKLPESCSVIIPDSNLQVFVQPVANSWQNYHAWLSKVIIVALLPFIAGGVNAHGCLALGRYVSHVTGHVALLGMELAQAHRELAWLESILILHFLLGVMLCGVLDMLAQAHGWARHSMVFIAEACGLALFAQCMTDESSGTLKTAMAATLCLVMGMHNAVVRQSFGSVVRTTHLTGICTDLGLALTHLLLSQQTLRHASLNHYPLYYKKLLQELNWAQLRQHVVIFATYLLGALSGTCLYLYLGAAAMLLYCGLLLGVAYYDWQWGLQH